MESISIILYRSKIFLMKKVLLLAKKQKNKKKQKKKKNETNKQKKTKKKKKRVFQLLGDMSMRGVVFIIFIIIPHKQTNIIISVLHAYTPIEIY